MRKIRNFSDKYQISLIIIGILTLILPYANCESSIYDDAGRTNAAFLKVDAGSRPVSMGSAFVGVADDVNTIFWNPAGLTSIENREFTGMHNFSFADINNESFGYAQTIGNKGVFGISILGTFASIERRKGPTEEPVETFNAGSFAAGLSYSHEIVPNLSIGGTAKFINRQLDVEDMTGGAFDVGGIYRLGNILNIGASLCNLGTIDFESRENEDLPEGTNSLPTKVRAGAALYPSEKLIIAGDVNVPMSGDPTFHVGAERWFYHDIFAIRAGYNYGDDENPSRGLTAGLGVRAYGTAPLEKVNFQFDYAYVPDKGLGDSHRVSFITRF